MICLAISDKQAEAALAQLNKAEMAEIRLDLTEYSENEIARVFSHPTPCIATCRPEKLGYARQLEILSHAIASGAKYVDIEIEAPEAQREAIIRVANAHQCKVIISYHNYDETPGLRELYKIVDECYNMGADIAKLAVMANSKADAARILSLYSTDKPLVALGMGKEGKLTRIIAPLLGAAFTFAAKDDGTGTAPGQITYSEMKNLESILRKAVDNK